MPDPIPAKMIEEKRPSSFLNLLHIALDTYDDIFSDFDPSGYDRRVLSDDFMKEMQKRYVETRKGDIELRFSIPEGMRSPKTELLIKKRLKEYFQMQLKLLDAEIDKRKKAGIIYFGVGFLVLLITVYSAEFFPSSHVRDVLAILLTPLGWFGMWEGIGLFVQAPVKYDDQRRFYLKFIKANYVFMNEEDFLVELAELESSETARAEASQKKA